MGEPDLEFIENLHGGATTLTNFILDTIVDKAETLNSPPKLLVDVAIGYIMPNLWEMTLDKYMNHKDLSQRVLGDACDFLSPEAIPTEPLEFLIRGKLEDCKDSIRECCEACKSCILKYKKGKW